MDKWTYGWMDGCMHGYIRGRSIWMEAWNIYEFLNRQSYRRPAAFPRATRHLLSGHLHHVNIGTCSVVIQQLLCLASPSTMYF